jgi:anti-anti-sigma regulatory factor
MASFQQILDSGAAELVIRFDHHASVNGTGIALLTRLLRSARHAGLQVRIAGLSENFRTIFDMLGITRIAPCIEPSANLALKGSITDGK